MKTDPRGLQALTESQGPRRDPGRFERGLNRPGGRQVGGHAAGLEDESKLLDAQLPGELGGVLLEPLHQPAGHLREILRVARRGLGDLPGGARVPDAKPAAVSLALWDSLLPQEGRRWQTKST